MPDRRPLADLAGRHGRLPGDRKQAVHHHVHMNGVRLAAFPQLAGLARARRVGAQNEGQPVAGAQIGRELR